MRVKNPQRKSKTLRHHGTRALALLAGTLVGAATLAVLSGCWLPVAIGGMVESYRETSTHEVKAEYTGLDGKSFAVLVYVDRVLQGAFPQLAARVANATTNELARPERTGAAGFVPVLSILEFQLSRPDWTAWSYEQLGEEFGVDRLIIIELYEYRLNEPGNRYVWDGLAAATVGIVEMDSGYPNEFVFSKEVQVGFPDQTGLGPTDYSSQQVRNTLDKRLIDRITWIMYDHQEPYYPDY